MKSTDHRVQMPKPEGHAELNPSMGTELFALMRSINEAQALYLLADQMGRAP